MELEERDHGHGRGVVGPGLRMSGHDTVDTDIKSALVRACR